jgi:hypothetical protein
MIDPAQIPIEVRDALLKPITYPAGTSEENKMVIRFAAALAAWPGKQYRAWDDVMGTGLYAILPLTEARDE